MRDVRALPNLASELRAWPSRDADLGSAHQLIEMVMWELFAVSGDSKVDARLQDGIRAMRVQDPAGLEHARSIFTEVGRRKLNPGLEAPPGF